MLTIDGSSPQRDRGQAMAEFAIVAPILFLLLFGVIQLGLLFGSQNGLVNGVRDAARRAVTYRVNDASLADPSILGAVCSAVEDELNAQLSRAIPGFDNVRLNRTVSYHWETNPGPAPSGETDNSFLFVRVQASYDHPLYVPLVGIFFDALDGTPDNAFTLSASEEMRIENPSLPLGATPPACT
jgi:Flp pilus assembly protein TadG